MTDLERALFDLGEHLDYPEVPHLAASVRAQVVAGAAPRRPWWAPSANRRVLSLAAVVAFVAAATLAFSAPARRAVADLFGLPGVIFSHEPAPVAPEGGPAVPDGGLRLGDEVSLSEARGRVDFELALPAGLGPPDGVYVDEAAAATVVSVVYRPTGALPEAGSTGVGLLLSQFRGRLDDRVVAKFLGPGSRMEAVTVDGRPGYWLPAPPHVVLYLDRNGEIREDTARLAANVLLWDDAGVIRRLESSLSRDAALAIARSAG
ncbi:MAG: hypothetical protein ACRD0C_05530 [Acidimicrobiia bacterium]